MIHKGQTSLARATFEAPFAASEISAGFQGSTYLVGHRQIGLPKEVWGRRGLFWAGVERRRQELPVRVEKGPDECGHHGVRSFVLDVGCAISGWDWLNGGSGSFGN